MGLTPRIVFDLGDLATHLDPRGADIEIGAPDKFQQEESDSLDWTGRYPTTLEVSEIYEPSDGFLPPFGCCSNERVAGRVSKEAGKVLVQSHCIGLYETLKVEFFTPLQLDSGIVIPKSRVVLDSTSNVEGLAGRCRRKDHLTFGWGFFTKRAYLLEILPDDLFHASPGYKIEHAYAYLAA
jgi:hypothetical protein